LRNLESVNLVDATQLVLGNLRAEQEHLREEAEKEIAKQALHLDETRASYQGLSNDLHKSKPNAKSAEGVITSAWEAIAKAQALVQDNEQILAHKRRIEELEAIRS